jgi:hypothetical protein
MLLSIKTDDNFHKLNNYVLVHFHLILGCSKTNLLELLFVAVAVENTENSCQSERGREAIYK